MLKNPTLLLLLLLASLGLATPAQAQSDFRPGYIIVPAGDTVQGLVDFRGIQRNGRLCSFRSAAKAPVQEYQPEALRGYGFLVEQRHYQAHITPPSSETKVEPGLEGLNLNQKRYFLEVLVPGRAMLFTRRDEQGADYYYLSVGDKPLQILEQIKVVQDVVLGQAQYRMRNLYRATLAQAFADCPASQQGAGQVPFSVAALSAAVRQYNTCVGGTIRQAASTKARVQLGVVAGAQISTLTFKGPGVASSYSSGVGPVFGLSVTLPLTNLSTKLALRVEALYEQQTYDKTFTAPYARGYYPHYQQHFVFSHFKVPVMLRYTLPGQHALRTFVNLGGSYAQALSHDTEEQIGYSLKADDAFMYGPVTSAFTQAIGPSSAIRRFELGLIGGLGFSLPVGTGHQLALELRAERGTGPVHSDEVESSRLRYFALLSYNLTK